MNLTAPCHKFKSVHKLKKGTVAFLDNQRHTVGIKLTYGQNLARSVIIFGVLGNTKITTRFGLPVSQQHMYKCEYYKSQSTLLVF